MDCNTFVAIFSIECFDPIASLVFRYENVTCIVHQGRLCVCACCFHIFLYNMMTSWHLSVFRIIGPLSGESSVDVPLTGSIIWSVNTLRPRQNGCNFTDDNFKCVFLNENVWLSINISLKFVPKGSNTNILALVQLMTWCRTGDKPLSEQMVYILLTLICVIRPQLVNVFTCQNYILASMLLSLFVCMFVCLFVCDVVPPYLKNKSSDHHQTWSTYGTWNCEETYCFWCWWRH